MNFEINPLIATLLGSFLVAAPMIVVACIAFGRMEGKPDVRDRN